jgi:tripartite-type tricarboxylate transporter receptor subunit TctC
MHKVILAAAAAAFSVAPSGAFAWEPTKTVEFIVPAGSGGGADQMARTIQGVVQKHEMMDQALVVLNKSGGSGGEGFLDVKGDEGNPHKVIITLTNLFTTPLSTGIPFKWQDITPVAMLALDEFVFWVNSDSPYKSVSEYIKAVKDAGPNKFQMGGTGSKQEDQIITAAIEESTGTKFTYVPFKGGGAVVTQLVGGHINSSVNNPIEAVAQWRAGKVRPLCVFDAERLKYTDKVTSDMAWSDIPTCKESGIDMDYLMLRGIFMPGGVEQEAVDFYVDLFKKVRETDEWKKFMSKGAFNQSFMVGDEYKSWVSAAADRHKKLMDNAGFTKK